jgi:hypothetical protein
MENKIIELDGSQELNNLTLNVYIVHRSDFTERKKLMEENKEIFEKLGIKINWTYIEKYDIKHLMDNIKDISSSIKIEQTEFEEYNELIENLHINHLSNIYNHLDVLNKIKTHYNELNQEHQDNNMYMVLEDDVFLMNTFVDNMKVILNELHTKNINYDLIFLGIPLCIDNKTDEKKTNDIQMTENITLNYIKQYLKYLPSCDSFLINAKILNNEDLYNEINKVKLIYNFELSYIIQKFNLNAYYSRPHLMLDGSKMGIIPSSININNVHIYNNEFMSMIQILNLPEEEFNKDIDKYEKEFNNLYDLLKDFNNPDILHLNAIFHNKMKKYEIALNIFKYAHKRYSELPSNISNDSNFIIDYIKTYEKLQ